MYMKYANRGDKDAMYNLAGCYWSGNGGVAQDYQSAFNWYEKAAKKNHQPAQHMTALCYLYGIGTVQDWRKAWDYADKAIKKGFGPSYWIKAQVFKEGYMSNISNGYLTNLTNAANSGYAKAMSELGALYLKGSDEYSVKPNAETGYNWVKRAADEDDAEGQYYLALCYDAGVGVREDHDKYLEYVGKSAQQGYAAAQAAAGYAFLTGDSVDVDYSAAYDYFKAAAEQDNAYAYGKIGDMYFYGLGVEENNNTAMDMYKAASNLGDTYSMCQLAYMYQMGYGASVDPNLMYKYYKQAADLNYHVGQVGVGDCYLNGYGVTQNEYTAFQWYKKAADQESGPGLYRLAGCYQEGKGTNKDKAKYIEYLEKAAAVGYTDAKMNLGYEYWQGENVSANNSKAVKWFKEAAEENDAFSQALLGYAYYRGEDFVSEKDYNQAFTYLTQAARNNYFEQLDDSMKADVYRCLSSCYRYGRGVEADQSLASYYTEQAAKYGNSDSQRAAELIRNKENAPVNRSSSYSRSNSSSTRKISVPSNRIETNTHTWELVSVEIGNDVTYLNKRATPKSVGTYVSSEAGEYIEDAETGRKYYITASSVGAKIGDKKALYNTNPFDFKETYPALPSSVKVINVSSGSQYYVKNLRIR